VQVRAAVLVTAEFTGRVGEGSKVLREGGVGMTWLRRFLTRWRKPEQQGGSPPVRMQDQPGRAQ
jgi:hypothetical protein